MQKPLYKIGTLFIQSYIYWWWFIECILGAHVPLLDPLKKGKTVTIKDWLACFIFITILAFVQAMCIYITMIRKKEDIK